MYQKIIVPIDHGNRNLKTEQHVFTSGILESDCKPVLGEFLQYNGRYYTLSEQRIPYMRDKSSDERFFILTLFGIVMEAERQRINAENTILGYWRFYTGLSAASGRQTGFIRMRFFGKRSNHSV